MERRVLLVLSSGADGGRRLDEGLGRAAREGGMGHRGRTSVREGERWSGVVGF